MEHYYKKIDTVQINEEQVLNSITNYYGTQIGILSDSVIKCSISKFLKMSYKELDKEANELLTIDVLAVKYGKVR